MRLDGLKSRAVKLRLETSEMRLETVRIRLETGRIRLERHIYLLDSVQQVSEMDSETRKNAKISDEIKQRIVAADRDGL